LLTRSVLLRALSKSEAVVLAEVLPSILRAASENRTIVCACHYR